MVFNRGIDLLCIFIDLSVISLWRVIIYQCLRRLSQTHSVDGVHDRARIRLTHTLRLPVQYNINTDTDITYVSARRFIYSFVICR